MALYKVYSRYMYSLGAGRQKVMMMDVRLRTSAKYRSCGYEKTLLQLMNSRCLWSNSLNVER
jgi:hypothetical protein